ncbi:PolA DNA polymerase I - 3'-5' exonuclease and polymerase domains [Candidatus Nanopelagicaceae bacterium]
MTKRLLLIDGHSMAYRAFFALPAENFTTAQGQHTNAIYGFATMLISLIKEEKPTHIAVAFDVSRKTFRTDIFPEYKANRSKTPDEFRSQMSYLHELVSAFGIQQFEIEGYEADDIIATITKRAEKEKCEVLICTGDRDSFQLVNDQTTILYPKRGVSEMSRMTPEAVIAKYGMSAEQYPDFAALRGDPSDNLPSVPGVGEKTAAKWIVDFGSLKNLLSNVDTLGGKVGQSLRDNIDNVIRNRELTQLVHDAPMDFEIDALMWGGPDEELVTPLFEKLEFRTLKERLAPLLKKTPEKSTSTPTPDTFFETPFDSSILTPEEASEKIAEHTGEIAIAFEVVDEKLHRYCIALNRQDSFIVHSSQMGSWAVDIKVPKIAHDAKSVARNYSLAHISFDTNLAAYLLNPGTRSLDFTDIIERWGDGTQIDLSSAEAALHSQARLLFNLRDSLSKELKERELESLFNELELPISELLATMESKGIAVDRKKLESLAVFFEKESALQTKIAHEAVGHEFNLASPKQLQVVLFDELKLPKTKKIKTGYTTDADALNWLFEKSKHPVLAAMLRVRETKKLGATVEGLLTETTKANRIHTHFAQTVAATGRLSSVGPNLQNIPVRTEEGRQIRECFIAGPGFESLLTADYSQIEMRIMAHLSNDAALLKAFESGEDLHASVAGLVFGVKPSEVDPEMRRQMKAMSYGLAYGLSAYGLAAQLDLSASAAQDLMNKYFIRFGGIRDYLSDVVEQARKVGYTQTVMGRRRYLPDLSSDNRPRREIAERMALNAPIQGSAADIIKKAMLNVSSLMIEKKLKSQLLLQVHDELIFEVAPGEVEALTQVVRKGMGSAFELRAPLDVSIGIGSSWNEAAH